LHIPNLSMRYRNIIITLLLIASPIFHFQGNTLTEHQARAAYIYNFIKFITWPEHVFKTADQPICITFFGHSEVEKEFKELIQDRTINDRHIEVKVIYTNQELDSCHIVYLNDIERRYQISTINALKNDPVLTISNAEYFTRIGGMIHFIIADDRLCFEINRSALEAVNLEVSAKLLRVARVVE